ncbi:Alkaline phosphatase precursor [Pelotomaculum schinkii]|uniref:Alkaline phosphatase n=1 Tax=Pelotomaculum schinkii TaxID=78350 RepID=A0A4Y7RGZ8_9FIRM|nr:metallophosphoesterase family protein [Pelotomaculum schinkii]TEB08063.1 Alkaline phosphatase precursor [Pelotomaculum schinkii]
MSPGFGYSQRNMAVRSKIMCPVLMVLAVFFCWFLSPVALAEESAAPEQIILTWTLDPAASQTITWLTPDNSPARVQYISADEFAGNFDAAQEMNAECSAFDSTHYRFKVNITGLTPETKYVYQVGREEAWSGPLSFTTASDTQEFSFLYMGDVQSGYAEWGSTLDAVYQSYPQIKFALLGGDLTDNDSDEEEWGQFLAAATVLFSRIPVMPAMGNHDGDMYLDFFALPDNGPEGLKQEFYSFDYGNAHFVVLNSNKNTDEGAKQWLQNDLQGTTKKWKFVVFHIPAYPATYDYKGIDKSIRANWVPVLEQNRVDMVFVGHQHEYMRTHPIYQEEVQTEPSYGIVYVMGNAGSKTYGGGGEFPYIAVEQTGSNYQVIDIEGDVLTLTSEQSTGELIERYMINKGDITEPGPVYRLSSQPDPAYTAGTTPDGINTMTVDDGVTGFKYFAVSITPVISHSGNETVVFTHFRNGSQLALNATRADFDQVEIAQAGFNVQPGDVIKVYIVDNLTNDTGVNPVILQ